MKSESTVRLRVLMLEDNPADAELVLYELQRAGIDADTVRVITQEEFEARLDPCPDAILSDFQLPLWDGLQALRLVRERGLDVPFIIVSGTIGEDLAVEAMRHGADDYLLKDRLSRLSAALNQALERKRLRTEAHAAAEAMRESEAGLHRAQVMARLAHVVTGPKGEFLKWSDTLPLLAGLDDAAMPATTGDWMQLVHPDDRANFRAKAVNAARSGMRTEVEYRLKRAPADWVFIKQVLEPLEGQADAEGAMRWFTTLQDVTEQKQAATALQTSEERFRAMFEKAAVGIAHTDLNGRFVTANPKLCEIIGYTAGEAQSLTFRDLTHPEDVQQSIENRARMMAGTAAPYERETRVIRRDGSCIWAHITTSLVQAADGKPLHFISVIHDITDRKAAETRIRRLNRVYAVLSGINTMIVRVRDRNELFREACRIAVDHGKFHIAWIGVVNRDLNCVDPAALYGGDPDFVETLRNRDWLEADKDGNRPAIGRVLIEKKAVFSDDIRADPRIRHTNDHVRQGTRSLAVMPLMVADSVAAVMCLHAPETGFFDEQEQRLLLELAGDISFALENFEKQEKLDYLAFYDQLTGLANRTLLLERLNQHIRAAGHDGSKLALVLFDVVRLRTINESLGRRAGDALLKQVVNRLVLSVDRNDLGRLGADHFTVVLRAVKGKSEVARRLEKMWRDIFSEPFTVQDIELRISPKSGITLYPNDGTDADTLLKNAEAAHRKSGEAVEPMVFYTQGLTERTTERLTLENKLRQALENDEFVLHYQPKVELESRRIVGVEALIRWQSSDLGLVPPMKFIPLMEETGLILPVGSWALKRASLDHRRWTEQKLKAPRVAVNVSAIQLRQRDFVAVVKQAIIEGVAPTGIDLEITESLIMEDIQGNIEKLKSVRQFGVQIAIDDFGTGYSSLGYLAKLPVQTLKIDRSFIITMLNDPDTMTLVQTIISLAHSLRLKVVAEGVDAEDQAKMLRLLRCDEMQGYLISKPVPFEQMTALLTQGATI